MAGDSNSIVAIVDTQTGAAAEAVQSGSITINGDMKAAASGDVSAITKSGDILINGTAAANAGNVTAQSGGGTITINGSMTSNQNGDVSAMTQDCDVLINDSVTAVKGNVTAKSANGNVTIGTAAKDGIVMAGLAAALKAVNGNVTVHGNVIGGYFCYRCGHRRQCQYQRQYRIPKWRYDADGIRC